MLVEIGRKKIRFSRSEDGTRLMHCAVTLRGRKRDCQRKKKGSSLCEARQEALSSTASSARMMPYAALRIVKEDLSPNTLLMSQKL
jgi:hypothetical protein